MVTWPRKILLGFETQQLRETNSLISNMANHQQFFAASELQTYSNARPLRISSTSWCLRKATNNESAVFELSICPQYNTANNGGFKLVSFDVVYAVSQDALSSAPTETLSTITYNSAAVPTVATLACGGTSYPTAVNPVTNQTYVINRTVTSPVLLHSGVVKMALELTFPCTAATLLDIYGINIRYSTATTVDTSLAITSEAATPLAAAASVAVTVPINTPAAAARPGNSATATVPADTDLAQAQAFYQSCTIN